MDFDFSERGPKARQAHFRCLRDRLPELVPYMRNAVGVEVRSLSRAADGTVIREALWRGAVEEVPALVRPMVQPEMLRWIERTTWREADWSCAWEIHLPGLPQLFTARGHNAFSEADGAGTAVAIRGEFTVHPEVILPMAQGVPAPLVNAVIPRLERFVVQLLDPNLREQHRAVHLLLDAG